MTIRSFCASVFLLSLCFLTVLWSQIADDATVKVYLDWQKGQPAVLSWDQEDFLARYRMTLEAKGISRTAVERTITALSHRLDADEAAFWSKIYSEPNPGFNNSPNRLLMEAVNDRKPGRALSSSLNRDGV